MTNLECAVVVLERHREARQWTDEAVAREMLAKLGLDEASDVMEPPPPPYSEMQLPADEPESLR